jgi:hypothetical protein
VILYLNLLLLAFQVWRAHNSSMENEPEKIQIEINLLENMSKEITNETSRLEKFTDRILAKLSSVITLSGVLTFLSFAFIPNKNQLHLLQLYLIWIFPYLLAAIAIWIVLFKKSGAITAVQMQFVESRDPKVTVQYLRTRMEVHQGVYNGTSNIYHRTRKLFAFSLSLIVAYLSLYMLAFYASIFFRLPDNTNMMLITIIMLLLSYFFRSWYLRPISAVNVTKDIKLK